jgi:hypothetical protein
MVTNSILVHGLFLRHSPALGSKCAESIGRSCLVNLVAGHDKSPIKSASLFKWWAWFKKPAGPKRQVITFNFPGPCKKTEYFLKDF